MLYKGYFLLKNIGLLSWRKITSICMWNQLKLSKKKVCNMWHVPFMHDFSTALIGNSHYRKFKMCRSSLFYEVFRVCTPTGYEETKCPIHRLFWKSAIILSRWYFDKRNTFMYDWCLNMKIMILLSWYFCLIFPQN